MLHKLHLGDGIWLQFDHCPGVRDEVTLYNKGVASPPDWNADQLKHDGYPYTMIDDEPLISYEDKFGDPLDPATLMDVMD